MQRDPGSKAHIQTTPDLGATAQIQKQGLATIFQVLATGFRAGRKRHHFIAVFLYPEHEAQIERMVILSEIREIGLHPQQHLLGGGILKYIPITGGHERAASHRAGTQFMIGVHQTRGEHPLTLAGQIGRVVVSRRYLTIEQRQRLGRGHIRRQHTIGGTDIPHACHGRQRRHNP